MKSLHLCVLALTLSSLLSWANSVEISYPKPAEKPARPVQTYLIITKTGYKQPKEYIHDWFSPPHLYSAIDDDLDGKVTIDQKSPSYPVAINKMKAGTYYAQAVIRLAPDCYIPGGGAGDQYSKPQKFTIERQGQLPKLKLHCDQTVAPEKKSKRGRIITSSFKSKALSTFLKRDFKISYCVQLPKNYDKTKKYPVVIYNTGYTGTHRSIYHARRFMDNRVDNCIFVVPDANNYWGHSVFADSAINGPWGKAMTEDFLPYIDKTYGGAGPKHRYLTGVSSGGWSSLWLMINYPSQFAGTWSYAPDPLDFQKFQLLDLYNKDTTNLYWNKENKPTPMSFPLRMGKSLKYKNMAAYERVLGAGSQLKSFGAVFSPALKNGDPKPWYNEATGDLNKEVIEHWKKYDICRIFPNIWKQHQTELKGKINLLVHQKDIFFLTSGVKSFEKVCASVNCDASFTYLKGAGHHIPKPSTKKMFDTIEKNWKNR